MTLSITILCIEWYYAECRHDECRVPIIVLLNAIHYVDCRYAECCYAECLGAHLVRKAHWIKGKINHGL